LGHVNKKSIQSLFQETVFQTNNQGSNSYVLTLCAACNLSRMRRCSSDCVTMFPRPEKFTVLKQGDLKAGEGCQLTYLLQAL